MDPVPVDVGALAGGLPRAPALVAQVGSGAAAGPGFGPAPSFLLSLGLYLVVGTVLLALAPRASRRAVERIHAEPLSALVVGVVGQVAAAVVGFLLAITVVGLIVAIPGLIVWALVGLAGNTLAAVAVGALATEIAGVDGRAADLVVGAVVLSALALVPVAGTLVGFVVGSIGLGALLSTWREGRSGGPSGDAGGRERSYERPHVRR